MGSFLTEFFMAFVNSWAIAFGIVAAGLPLLIHWLTRPRPVVRELSTIRFVLLAVNERKARHRLRDLLILAIRTAAILLLAMAVARPLFGRKVSIVDEESGNTNRVVLLDVSQSMAARTGGIQAFERARSIAAAQLAFHPDMVADLVLAGASPRPVFDKPSSNFGALRDELGKTAPRPERIDVQAALNVATRLLASAEAGMAARRELVIVSDFQRSQWASADFSALPSDTLIKLESTASSDTPSNLAILRVGSAGRAEQGRALQIEVEVGDFSIADRRVEVELSLGDATYRLAGFCRAGAKTTLTAEAVLRTTGWQSGRAKLIANNDALPEDDERAFVVHVSPPPLFAIVTRQIASARPASSYYLERALVPTAPRDDRPGPRAARFDPHDPDRDALGASDVIVIDHPGRMADALLTQVAAWLRRGKGVLYAASEAADAANLERLADLAGADLRLPVAFVPAPAGQLRAPQFIANYERQGPPFEVFGDAVASFVAPLRFSGTLGTRPLPGGLADDVRATYGDRSAGLVITTCGAGFLAILNADLGSSNLVASPAFVPLIGELTATLLGTRGIAVAVSSGEPFAIPLSAEVGARLGLAVAPADPSLELTEERDGLVLRAAAAGRPGITRVSRDDRPVFAVAAVVPEPESDLTPLDSSVILGRLVGDRQVSYRDANEPEDEEDTLWPWLIVGCLTCLAGEWLLSRAFRT